MLDHDLPFMTHAVDVVRKDLIPEAVNVDNTARVQTVGSNSSCREFRRLLEFIKVHTGIGQVINTSFNLAGEPIVETPTDAIRTFVSSSIDYLYIGPYVAFKHS